MRKTGTTLAVAAALALCAGSAHAQNRLGDGRGYQRDTRQYPRGVPPISRDVNTELQLRNAVVTGNVPGSSFRADVGYASPLEFRGELGSDDLYAFRRDSLYSGLGGTGIRGTDALQYQFGLSTGSAPSGVLTGSLIIDRSFRAAAPDALRAETPSDVISYRTDPYRDMRGQELDRGARLSALRSTSMYLANRSLSAELLGRRPLDTGDSLEVTAGGLPGVRFDVRRADQVQSIYEQNMMDRRLQNARDNPNSVAAESAAGQPVVTRSVYEDIRAQLNASLPVPRPGQITDEPADPRDELEIRLRDLRERLRRGAEAPEATDEGPAPAPQFDPETLDAIRTGEKIDAFVKGEAALQRDTYTEHMRAGQSLLAEGRYFDAEGRFTAALGAQGDDPLAMAGRLNAQAGAGMLSSASINLRNLLTDHPELAGVRYGDDLLPDQARLRDLLSVIDDRMDESSTSLTDLLLLKAYLAFQLGDNQATLDAFTALARQRDENETPPDPVADFARRIWVEQPQR